MLCCVIVRLSTSLVGITYDAEYRLDALWLKFAQNLFLATAQLELDAHWCSGYRESEKIEELSRFSDSIRKSFSQVLTIMSVPRSSSYVPDVLVVQQEQPIVG